MLLSTWDLVLRLGVAVICGAVLGWEREAQHKPAGLRTHILVSLGSAAFMLAALQLHQELVAKNQAANSDLMKVLGGIVGGIGFLGAGSIIQAHGNVRGLTTAATVWLTAAVGLAAGLGYFRLAAISTVLALVVLIALGWLEVGRDYLDNGHGENDPAAPDDAKKTE